jgi:hypothetical protein
LLVETKSAGFRERVKGIWLPEKQVGVQYDDEGKLLRIVSNSLLEARFNDVPDEFFALPKGEK